MEKSTVPEERLGRQEVEGQQRSSLEKVDVEWKNVVVAFEIVSSPSHKFKGYDFKSDWNPYPLFTPRAQMMFNTNAAARRFSYGFLLVPFAA